MTTYNELAGRRVNFLSTDPTYVDTNTNGQVWYNSTSATLKAWLPTGAWSSGANLNTARGQLGSSGTQTAALGFSGTTPGVTYANTESYNGIAWTPVSNMNTGRRGVVGAGTQTSSVAFGGVIAPGATSGATESWNGSSWTSSPNSLGTARYFMGGAGTQTAALGFGGKTTDHRLPIERKAEA